MVLDPQLASVHQLYSLFHGDYDNLLQWPFSKIIHIGIHDQLEPLNAWTKTIQAD